MHRIILSVWTDSIINVLTRQSWERFCNSSKLIRGISHRHLQSFGKDGLLPFPSSYLLSGFRSTLPHSRTSLPTANRQFWRTFLDGALRVWSAHFVLCQCFCHLPRPICTDSSVCDILVVCTH